MDDLIDWLVGRKNQGRYSKDTWWQYKSAVMACLNESQQDFAEQVARLRDEPTEGVRPKGRSPKGKSRSITGKKRDYLFRVADHYAKPLVAHRIKTFIDAGILTGLRPVEWVDARLDILKGRPVLTVVNAKHTNERSHGETRRMEILTRDGVHLIREQLRLIQEYKASGQGRTGESYIRSVRAAMNHVYQRAKQEEAFYGIRNRPDRVYLYSARHQFKNDARRAGLHPLEIAYLMGHASVETNQHLYGRPGTKGGSFGVKRYAEIPQVLLDSQAGFEARRAMSPKRQSPRPGME